MVSALQDSGVWIMSTPDISSNMHQSNNSISATDLNILPPPFPSSTSVDRVAVLERQMKAALAMIERLNEQIESLESQQTISVAGKKYTLDELTNAVADKLKAKANLW